MSVSKNPTNKDQLTRVSQTGLEKRYGRIDQQLQQQIDHELAIVDKFKLNDHVLILADLANYLLANEIPFSAGSGRSNGSLLLYALGITKLDPLPLNLSADYFYSVFDQRITPPVWFDLPDKYQDQILTYANNKYGALIARALLPGIDCVAMWHFTEALLKIREATKEIEDKSGIKIDLAAIPLDDSKTFALLASGVIAGIYGIDGLVANNENFAREKIEQYRVCVKSTGDVKQALISYKPTNFAELMIIVALFNLDPLAHWRADILPQLIHYKKLNTPASQPQPVLQNILKDTFGLLLYREQSHEVIKAVSDFNPTRAERFIKLIMRGYFNNKDKPAFEFYKEDFLAGGKANSYTDDQLQIILQFLYDGINKCTIKANTANHTLVAYHMAYLKAHYGNKF